MANGLWCGSCNDSVSRGAVNQATITVTDPAGELLGLFKDRAGTMPIGNPFLTREDGLIKFFVRTGRININAAKGGESFDFFNEVVTDYSAGCACGLLDADFQQTENEIDTTSVFLNYLASHIVVVAITAITDDPITPDGYIIGVNAPADGSVVHPVTQAYVPPSGSDGGYYIIATVIENPGDYISFNYHNGDDSGSMVMGSVQIFFGTYLTTGDCLIESIQVGYGEGSLALEAGSSCEKSFACAAIFSPIAGMGTAAHDGWDYWNDSAGAGPLPSFGLTNNYRDNTSQSVEVSIGSGLISGALIVMRTAANDGMFDRTDSKTVTVGLSSGFNVFFGFDLGQSYGSIAPNEYLFESDPQVGAGVMFMNRLSWDQLNQQLVLETTNFDWTQTKTLQQGALVSLSISLNGAPPVVLAGVDAIGFINSGGCGWTFSSASYDGTHWTIGDTVAVIITLHC